MIRNLRLQGPMGSLKACSIFSELSSCYLLLEHSFTGLGCIMKFEIIRWTFEPPPNQYSQFSLAGWIWIKLVVLIISLSWDFNKFSPVYSFSNLFFDIHLKSSWIGVTYQSHDYEHNQKSFNLTLIILSWNSYLYSRLSNQPILLKNLTPGWID